MKEKEINEAFDYIQTTPTSKNEMLMMLSSLTLISAAIKRGKVSKFFGYGKIKPTVTKIVCYCLEHPEFDLINDLYYADKGSNNDSQGNCIYMRCLGLQFSYHNITVNEQIKTFANSPANKETYYDAAYKQPRALGIYRLAKECLERNKTDEDYIKDRALKLDWDYPELLTRHIGEMADNGQKDINLETILANKFKVGKLK